MNYLEVCAGGGGLSLGAEMAGFRTIVLNEIDKTACETLKLAHPHTKVMCCDFSDIKFRALRGHVDVLAGGVPCQSFSQAGERKGLEDSRGSLIMKFINAVEACSPKAFLIENVKGLTTHNKGETLKTVIERLESIEPGYTVFQKILNAVHYGVAQKRERIFIVGIRMDVSDQPFRWPAPFDKIVTIGEVLEGVPESAGMRYPESKREVLDLVPQGGCWVDLPPEIQRSYMGASFLSGGGKRGMARRISLNEPCLTLTTSPMQKQTERCHPTETRPFTIREYARIQSFPDSHTFCGSVSSQYRQIGNAVPPRLAEAVLKSIASHISST